MSTSVLRQSRKRKLENMSLGSSRANFFRHQRLQNEISIRDLSDTALPRPCRISASFRVTKLNKSFKRRPHTHASQKGPLSCSSKGNAGTHQSASESSESDRKKGIKKSIAKLPKLFTRLWGYDSLTNESTDTLESKCSARNNASDLKTSKNKSHCWTKIVMRLTGNQSSSTSQQSAPPSSVFSFTDSSRHSKLESRIFQIDRAPSLKQNDFKHQLATRSSINKSTQTALSSSKSDPFGDIPSIPVPVLEPAKSLSWRKIQRKFSRRMSKKQFPQPMKGSDNDSIGRDPAESSIPSKLSLPASFTSASSESYPFGDVPSIFSSALKPVHFEVTASSTSTERNFFNENLQNKDEEKFATQYADSNAASSEGSGKNRFVVDASETVSHQSQITSSPLQRRPLPVPVTVQVQMPTTSIAMPNFNQATKKTKSLFSFNAPQFRESIFNDPLVHQPRFYANCFSGGRGSHLPAFSSQKFVQPASTQILKPVQNEEVSTPSSLTRSFLHNSAHVGSSSASSDSKVDAKFCSESAQRELSHFPVTHSGFSADSYGPVQYILPSELDSECVGQIFTSTGSSSRSLPEKNVQETIPATSSEYAQTSDLSSLHSLALCSSTSSSGNPSQSAQNMKISAHLTAEKLNFVSQPAYFGGVIKTSTQPEGTTSKFEWKKGSSQFGHASSSFSSSSTIFRNSSETINGSYNQKKASLTNLLLADSTSSAGLDAGISNDLRRTNVKGQVEFFASRSMAADEYSDPHSALTSRRSPSLVRQQSIKVEKGKTKGKRKILKKILSAFSTTSTEKNEYSELHECKAELTVIGRKKSIPRSKNKSKD